MSSRRELLIATAIVVVALVVGFVWMSRRSPEETAPAQRVAAAPQRTAAVAVGPTAASTPQRYTIRTESVIEIPAGMTPEQAKATAARYRRLARFPRTSRPIEDGIDPIAADRSAKWERSGSPKERGPHLIVFTTDTSYEAPATIVIHAQVVQMEGKEERKQREGDPQEVRVEARAIQGEVRGPNGAPAATIEFRDDGKENDAQADDRFFTASLTPDPDRPDAFRGQHTVEVTALAGSGEELTATTGFFYGVPTAHLTGQYRDSIVDGHLRIEAEVVVEEAGQFQLEGTLVTTANAEMLAYARHVASLTPGTTWIPLTYYGLILRERKADGPYSLFAVTLSRVGNDGLEETDVIPNAHTTRAYAVTDFSDQPFNDPEYLAAADRLDAIAQGRAAQ